MKKKGIRKGIEMAGIITAGMILAVMIFTYIYYVENVGSSYLDTELSVVMSQQFLDKNCIKMGVILSIIGLCLYWKGKAVGNFVYRYRFVCAGILLIVGIVFELSGSSIQHMMGFLGGHDTGVLLGTSRGIRSDEWEVLTPMLFSQYHNASGKFPYFSETVRGTLTDVFLIYGQPVADWAILFRPFYWGYLFLSIGKGMAFFWCGRYIALFLVSFEFGMLLTEKKKGLSVTYAFMMLFAPAVQWWFAINGFVEMLIYFQLSVLLLCCYMKTEKQWQRILCLAGIMISAGGFILTIYPAWQIPMAYLIAGVGIWAILENYQECRMQKRDWIMIGIAATVFCAAMAVIFYRSRETVEAIMNAAYPGKRIGVGGESGWENIVLWLGNLFYPMFGEGGIRETVVEDAGFFALFPVCYIPAFLLRFREKQKDKLLGILGVISIVFGIYCFIGFPSVLAKITLLSFSFDKRTMVILEFVGMLMMFRAISKLEKSVPLWTAVILSVAAGGLLAGGCYRVNPDYFPKWTLAVLMIISVVLSFGLLRYPKKWTARIWCTVFCCSIFFSGFLVNPIRSGVDAVEKVPVLQEISKIHESDEQALWIVEGMELPFLNAPIMVGAPTINSTNTYPDLERWRILDKSGKYEKYYNRYAHIGMYIKESGSTEFKISKKIPDRLRIDLTLDDMKKLGAKYIFTRNDLEKIETQDHKVRLVSEIDSYKIYEITEK